MFDIQPDLAILEELFQFKFPLLVEFQLVSGNNSVWDRWKCRLVAPCNLPDSFFSTYSFINLKAKANRDATCKAVE